MVQGVDEPSGRILDVLPFVLLFNATSHQNNSKKGIIFLKLASCFRRVFTSIVLKCIKLHCFVILFIVTDKIIKSSTTEENEVDYVIS